jgi:hypothetical protein
MLLHRCDDFISLFDLNMMSDQSYLEHMVMIEACDIFQFLLRLFILWCHVFEPLQVPSYFCEWHLVLCAWYWLNHKFTCLPFKRLIFLQHSHLYRFDNICCLSNHISILSLLVLLHAFAELFRLLQFVHWLLSYRLLQLALIVLLLSLCQELCEVVLTLFDYNDLLTVNGSALGSKRNKLIRRVVVLLEIRRTFEPN